MNAVVFYSNTGQSKLVAEYLANKLSYPLIPIGSAGQCYDCLVLVFPVHCQNAPSVVESFLSKTTSKYTVLVATYGKMCTGNVLCELQNKYKMNIIAGAYIPSKHTYLENDEDVTDLEKLRPLIEKIQTSSCAVTFPKLYKNPLANAFPNLRGRLGVKLIKNEKCNACGLCEANCPLNAISCGVPNKNCIRCLRCVKVCPTDALEYKVRLPLALYLAKKKKRETIIYI